MKVGDYTIRVLGEDGIREVRPDEEAQIQRQMQLVNEAAEAEERLDAYDLACLEEATQKKRA